jgi:glutamate synthase domain-containing protein 1
VQVFLKKEGMDRTTFERELYRVRKIATNELRDIDSDFYVCSLSGQTITYKGQLTPEQVLLYFEDLQDPTFTSHLALVHSRFSTNTFPSWDRAQPSRVMCHNGEINTLRGNKNWMHARSGMLESGYFGDDTSLLTPIVSDNMSDSGNLDSVLELMTKVPSLSATHPPTHLRLLLPSLPLPH